MFPKFPAHRAAAADRPMSAWQSGLRGRAAGHNSNLVSPRRSCARHDKSWSLPSWARATGKYVEPCRPYSVRMRAQPKWQRSSSGGEEREGGRARARPAPSSVGVFFSGGFYSETRFRFSNLFFVFLLRMRPGGPLRGLRRHPCGSRVPCRCRLANTSRAQSMYHPSRTQKVSSRRSRSVCSIVCSPTVTVHLALGVSVSFRSASPRWMTKQGG